MEVPALGSPKDVILRQYLIHEARVEAQKHKMALLLTIGSPMITDKDNRQKWDKQARDVFDKYVGLLMGVESVEDPQAAADAKLLEYYETVVKPSAPVLSKDKDGKLSVSGLPKGL